MLKLGIIGTSAITHQFVRAAHASKRYQLEAVFSRRLETAEAFAAPYKDVILYTDWQAFLAAPIDLVYIASPNALHFEQAKAILAAGKHAILEKPMVSTPRELQQLRSLAKEKGVFLFEAARNFQEAGFEVIRQFLADKTVLGAYFGYAKYSSKMPDLLAGKEPNIFSAEFSGGALMDLGVYAVYAAIGLLGLPKTARYTAQKLPSSVDLNGSGQLIYDDFIVTIQAGKNVTSSLPSEIYTSQGTLTLNACQQVRSAIFTSHDGSSQALSLSYESQPMLEEAVNFARVIAEQDRARAEQWLDVAEAVHHTLYTMRQDAGITFKADTYEN